MKFAWCLLTRLSLHQSRNPDLSSKVFPSFLGTIVPSFLGTIDYRYDLPHVDEPLAERTCITVAPVLPPYLRLGLAKRGEKVIHLYQAQCRILPDLASDKGSVVDTGAQRGAVKYSSEIIASTGRNHKMIGALGHAKTLPGIIMGCETVDVNGRPFTLVVRTNLSAIPR